MRPGGTGKAVDARVGRNLLRVRPSDTGDA